MNDEVEDEMNLMNYLEIMEEILRLLMILEEIGIYSINKKNFELILYRKF
jgi:hypothetical protein